MIQGEPIDALIGSWIAGRYRVLERIGSGGMGAVYAADQVAMRRRVALKIMRPELASDPALAARFEREAHAASRVVSPHVVTLFDHGRLDDGRLYIAMELLRGGSLADHLDRGPLPVAEALRLARAIARALDAAHEAGVVHRDLKPDNIFPGDDEWPLKVIDFGIAKMLDEPGAPHDESTRPLTQVGAIVGTPVYMSPEGASRKPVGPAGDLYALGVILFEMIVGRPPFDDPEPVMVLGMHLRLEPEPLAHARPDLDVPAALQPLLDRLLAKAPEHRPPNAAAVVTELDDIIEALRSPLPRITTPRTFDPPAPSSIDADEGVDPMALTLPGRRDRDTTPASASANDAFVIPRARPIGWTAALVAGATTIIVVAGIVVASMSSSNQPRPRTESNAPSVDIDPVSGASGTNALPVEIDRVPEGRGTSTPLFAADASLPSPQPIIDSPRLVVPAITATDAAPDAGSARPRHRRSRTEPASSSPTIAPPEPPARPSRFPSTW